MGALFDPQRVLSRANWRAGVLVLCITGATMTAAGAETLVETVHPNRLDVGTSSLGVLLTQPMRAPDVSAMDRAAYRAAIEGSYAGTSGDRLARDLLTSLDTVQTNVLMSETFRALGLDIGSSNQIIHHEDGSVSVLEPSEALHGYLLTQEVTSTLLSTVGTAEIAQGDTVLTVAGRCPFGDGPGRLSGLGLAVEIRRAQVPLLFCIPGSETLYCLASEPTRITLRIEQDGNTLEFGYGERGVNSEVYEAAIGDGPALLKGANWADCEITIARP